MSAEPLVYASQTARRARRTYAFLAAPDAERNGLRRVPVVIAGGGPCGLAMALDLARYGVECVVLERANCLSDGSRAICWAKRSLEFLDRLGAAAGLVARGVTWNVGKVFLGSAPEPIYTFDLLPEKDQKFPAFINLQQYYLEEALVERLAAEACVELRWQHAVKAVRQDAAGVTVDIGTPLGDYTLACDYLIAADGCRSTVRSLLGLDFAGRSFNDNFLIADIRMKAPFPAERRFWFDPPFNRGRTALMHRQPDDLWRLDFQLGPTVDRRAALEPAAVAAKVHGMLGAEIPFEYEWVSIYDFQCRRMERFVHGRVLFVGDAAHLVSPFGARGANGGLQDVDNLGWKLARVLAGRSPPALLDSYDVERCRAADENILNSARATDFMTAATPAAQAYRDAVLELARDFEFARPLVNSGRLSRPAVLDDSPLSTPEASTFEHAMRPGAPCVDAPLGSGWLLEKLGGRFVALHFAADDAAQRQVPAGVELVVVRPADDREGLAARRYDAAPGTTYLVRPDQHVCARWRAFDPHALDAAVKRATVH
ncbi:MAG: FAD-dependent oxidoreductase [Gammaproteobacteria bacterium]|nr:FAD-dependent oxidoreductase [Gammaproteobacteria bacterium]